jgi:hypothetical protein
MPAGLLCGEVKDNPGLDILFLESESLGAPVIVGSNDAETRLSSSTSFPPM